ncbi:ovalbumin-related protein X-like [Bacillus rossius redtenbacheri]|uniref:ovalbumin-related protein X-like n=1 Tax=Bacillus rossius redtenbacheri TaxID=93214 RepID=UPI002FDEDA23
MAFNIQVFVLLMVAATLEAVSLYRAVDEKNSTHALKAVSRSNNNFTVDLLKAIEGDRNENLVISPLSLHAALGFLAQGAQGSTKQQILKAAYLPSDDNATREGFRAMLHPLRNNTNYTLHLANAAFVEKSFPLKQSFREVARSSFMADAKTVDFANNASGAIDAINQWAKNSTAGKIRNFMSQNDADSKTKFVLANALYFNGTWEKGFNASQTKKRPFHVNSETTVQTDMMTTTAGFNYTYSKELGAQVLALNYKGGDIRMIIGLPDNIDGLEALESKIDELKKTMGKLFPQTVNVTLPKFKIEQEIYYDNILQKLGITEVFSPEANLSGISDVNRLAISNVKQKAVIEVSENGTVSSAATETTGTTLSQTYDFIADHGFLYLIEHVPTSAVIICGRYTKP